jgi:hypothetical protein
MRLLLRRRIVVPVFILFAAIGACGWVLSRSEIAHRLVERKLEERLGASAQFESVSVGITGTTVANLQLNERGSGADSTPFLTVGQVDFNVGVVGALLDKGPSTITLRDASVLLRFDRHGELLTKLPNKPGGDGFPNLKIESGTLTIRQEGRADSVFHGIELTIAERDQNVILNGEIHDENWGKWTADGSIPTGPNASGEISLRTAEPQGVTPELLRQTPLVNPNAWNYVRLAGTTAAAVEFKIEGAGKHVAYRVALEPTRTSVEIPNIGLRFTDTAGKLVAENGVVTLSDVQGTSADGAVRVESRLDFSKPDSVLRFKADLSRMDVQKLPRSWRLPPQIDGRLSGKVDFVVTLPAKGGTRLDATGRATITDAKLKGRPIPPIELDVMSGPSGSVEFVQRTLPIRPIESGTTPPAAVVSSTLRLPVELVKQGDAPAAEKSYVHLNVTFREVELAELMKTAGVEFATKIAGKVTLQVQVEIPTDAPDDFKRYRMTGSAASRSLTIDELAIDDVSATLNMRDGKLAIHDFVGRLPALGAAKSHGSFTADGELEAGDDYAFHATVKLDRVALEQIERLKNLLPISAALAGEASADAELTGTLSPLTIRGSGKAKASRLQIGNVPAQDFSLKWDADNDLLHLREANVGIFGGKLSGQFDIPLRGGLAGSGSAKIEEIDLAELSKLLLAGANIKLAGKADGTLKVRPPAAGEGSAGITADIDLAAANLKFQGIPATKIKGTGAYAAGVFKYSLAAAALGGQIEVSGQYPPEKKPTPKPEEKKIVARLDLGKIKVKRVQMAGLWDLLGVKAELAPMDGEVSGEFPLNFDDDGRLVGAGSIYAERMSWKGHEMAGIGQAIVRITPSTLSVNEATLYMGEGLARISATHNRLDPDKSEADIVLTNVPANRLMFLFPELAKRFQINVSGRLATSFGKEWRGSGVLTAAKGRAFGIPMTDLRVPIDWVVSPSRGRTEVRVRDASATAAGGTMTARAEVNLFNDLPPRFSGDVQFRNANLSQAFRDAGKVVGNLQLTGKLEFAAEQYRNAEDLTGKLDAQLGESQPFSLPVFAALVPYLGVGRDYSTTIREGEVHAVLGRGVWRVQPITLTGPSLDLYADGTLTLGGRLNIAVTARSGERPAQTLLRRFMPASTLTSFTPSNLQLSRSALTDAASLVGGYVVYMEVSGTVESPTVRLQTVRTLSEATVRFFLFRFLMPL